MALRPAHRCPMFLLIGSFLALFATLCVASLPSAATPGQPGGWALERGVAEPSYAWAEPSATDLNIETVVLSCEQGPGRRGLQLRLLLADDGPLAPRTGGEAKAAPAVTIAIDGVAHPGELYFAGDSVLIADAADDSMPLLSAGLIDALQAGRRLELRFDLVREADGRPPAFDGMAAVDLQAAGGGDAVAAVRRCAEDGALASAAPARR